MCEKPKFYITTAIAYTSRKPHIGNSYEIVLTDAIARYKRMQGYDVFFLTGTDEHGQKIEEYAKDANVSPKEYVDKVAGEIKGICDLLNTTYDHFIRTTDDYHEKTVQKIFKKLYDQGDIYKSEYEGLYCTPCESFWTESQLVDGKCPDCGREVQPAKEEAYFLKLSKYQKQLEEFIESNENFIYPEARKKEMLNNFIKPGLQDLCVSRTSFKWGIPVTFDDKHVIYVWIDALSNYITALGYDPDGSSEQYKKYWPADVHIIGKDIVRFHTIYWPIMLMALGEPLPKQVYGHPWLLFGEDKMSKSRGNVIYADDLTEIFGVDAVRYYLLSEMPHANDGSITYEAMIDRFNTDLANTLGNLVNRTVAMQNKYFGSVIQAPSCPGEFDEDLKAAAKKAIADFDKNISEYKMSDAVESVISFARRCNKYIDETMPWSLAKDEAQKERLGTVLYNLLEGIRILSVLIAPIMPETTAKIAEQLSIEVAAYESIQQFGGLESGKSVGTATPLFSRIDGEKLIAELQAKKEKEMKKNAPAPKIEGLAQIGIEDFAKVELRVAEVKDCEPVKRAKKLLKLTLNDGTGTDRTVASGIAKWYKPDDLIGKKVVVVANLKPAVLCGVESNGMILAADCAEDECKVLFMDEHTQRSKNSIMFHNIFDSHAHYDDEKFSDDRETLLDSFSEKGVSGVISCGTHIENSKFAIKLSKKYNFIYSAVGFHPLDLDRYFDGALGEIKRLAADEKCVAIGEIGLDYHYEKETRDFQLEILEKQLILANELNLPVIFHDREAHEDTMSLLKKYRPRGVVHCFSGSVEMAREIVKLGMYIGLGGAVTFKNAVKPCEVARFVPDDRLLIETDAPYMTPVPFRGKRCDSLHIPYTAEKIAELRGVSAQDILDLTDKNAKILFDI